MTKLSASELPRSMTFSKRTYVELGIWEEKTYRKRDQKLLESGYYVEASVRNAPGKEPVRPTKSGKASNLVEARRLRDKLRADLDDEVFGKKPVTIAEYFQDTWFPDIAGRRSAAASYDVKCSFEGKVLPAIGSRPIVEITTRELNQFIEINLQAVSPTTKRKYRKLLNNFFKMALGDGVVSANPVPSMKPIEGGSRRSKEYLTTSQLTRLLTFMRENDHPYFLHVAVAALTGMRVNEQRGFQWRDIATGGLFTSGGS